jgi:PAP2 superfamily.
MLKITKRGLLEFGSIFLFFVGLVAIASFFDLQINQALYDPGSSFGQFLARLGEFPSYLAAPVVGAILFGCNYGAKKAAKISIKIAAALIIWGGFFYSSFWFFGNFTPKDLPYSMVYKVVFSLFFTAATILGTSKVGENNMRKLIVFAIVLAIVAALGNALVQIMKVLWERQRFRTMVDTEANAAIISMYGSDFKGFSPWYRPEFLFPTHMRTVAYIDAVKAVDSDAFHSFPSGHTVAAAASFAIVIIPETHENTVKFRSLFWIAPAVYTALVALSRMIVGAHYLSDVVFGGFIGFGIAALTRYIILDIRYRKLKKKQKTNPVSPARSE